MLIKLTTNQPIISGVIVLAQVCVNTGNCRLNDPIEVLVLTPPVTLFYLGVRVHFPVHRVPLTSWGYFRD